MKKSILTGFVLLGLLVSMARAQTQALRAGVVEFDEKNDIGLQNAGTIVPEQLVSHLKNIGKYQLVERIYLKKAFEEQKLQMTGAIDDKTIVEFGKTAGLQAIITGSCMKVGPDITISGRVINIQTADIIAAGAVKFLSVSELDQNLEKLAYLLSGTRADEYARMKTRQMIIQTRYGLRLGAGYAITTLDDFKNSGADPLILGAFRQSRYIDVDVNASFLSASQMFQVKLAINPFTHLGFGVGFQENNDELGWGDPAQKRYRAEYSTVLLGINYRVSQKLRASIYMGMPAGGEYTFQPGDSDTKYKYHSYTYKVKPFSSISGATISMEYQISPSLSLMLHGGVSGGESKFSYREFPNPSGTDEYWHDKPYFQNTRLGLMLNYSVL